MPDGDGNSGIYISALKKRRGYRGRRRGSFSFCLLAKFACARARAWQSEFRPVSLRLSRFAGTNNKGTGARCRADIFLFFGGTSWLSLSRALLASFTSRPSRRSLLYFAAAMRFFYLSLFLFFFCSDPPDFPAMRAPLLRVSSSAKIAKERLVVFLCVDQSRKTPLLAHGILRSRMNSDISVIERPPFTGDYVTRYETSRLALRNRRSR